jgi:hypothetical protein
MCRDVLPWPHAGSHPQEAFKALEMHLAGLKEVGLPIPGADNTG